MNKKVLLSVFAASLFAVPTSSALAEFTNVPNVQYQPEDANGNGVLDGGDLYYNAKGLANKDEHPLAKHPEKFQRYVQKDINGNVVEGEETPAKPAEVKKPEAEKPAAEKPAAARPVKKVLPKTSAVK